MIVPIDTEKAFNKTQNSFQMKTISKLETEVILLQRKASMKTHS